MNTTTPTQRNPLTAAALCFLLPGLGQVYCGAILRGLAYMALSCIALTAGILPGVSDASPAALWIVLLLITSVGIVVVAAIDSWRLACRTREDYRLKEYNRWQVYVLLVLIASGGAVGYALYIRDTFMQPFRIPNQSMYPSIRAGDMVLAGKGLYLDRNPEPGEVVIFRHPERRRQFWAKRVVAVAGDSVEIRDGKLYVNGEKAIASAGEQRTLQRNGKPVSGTLHRERRGNHEYDLFLPDDPEERSRNDLPPTLVPEHHVYVIGDNRSYSRDSRQIGPIPIAGVIGKVSWITIPGDDWSRVGRFEAR